MLKLIRALLFLVGLVLIVMLAIDNRGHVDVVFWPLPYSINVPLYWVFLFGLASGVFLGGLSVWLAGHKRRGEFRRVSVRAKELDQQERARRDAEERALVEEARRKTAALAISPPSRRDPADIAGAPGPAMATPRGS